MKENDYIIEGVKKKMVIEQKNNIKKYVSKLKKMYVFISDIGVDINNITDDERDSLNDYVEYFEVKWNMTEIMTIFKYNSYFINMLSVNLVNEKVVIDFISSEYFTKRWRKIPIIFPKSLLENLSLNLAYDY